MAPVSAIPDSSRVSTEQGARSQVISGATANVDPPAPPHTVQRGGFAHAPTWMTQEAWTDGERSISLKASSLGADFTGAATSPVESIGVGMQQTFANCIIYFSPATGPHEVHGDILRKYLANNGPAILGLPLIDEQGTPDGVGRYNHFALNASIYFSPNTGPMVVQGSVRDRWQEEGWERSGRGYPVRDAFSPAPGEWAGDFQNGVIWADPDGFKEAKVAFLTPDQLLNVIWSFFDKQVHQSPKNIGLHPEKSLFHVSDTAYDFWQSRNRLVTVQINGFHDNGLAPDADFTATIVLLLQATYRPSRLETSGQNGAEAVLQPAGYDITASLESGGSVHAGGIGNDELVQGVNDAIEKALAVPIPLGTIPAEVPLLSFKVGQNGGVYAIVSPTLAGGVAVVAIQHQMDSLG